MGDCILLKKTHKSSAPPPVKIVTWADGTDAEIAAMIQAANEGKITLSNYWSVGDERTVRLSAMPATYQLDDTHVEQDVVFVIMDTGTNSGYEDANGNTVNFVVGLKDCLKETGAMNATATNTGSWNSSHRRSWCNITFYMSIPSTFRSIFRQFKTYYAREYNSDAVDCVYDYFALFAEKESVGINMYAPQGESNALTQISYYSTQANRIKKVNGTATAWWNRSPWKAYSSGWCLTDYNGSYSGNVFATNKYGLAPFGCI